MVLKVYQKNIIKINNKPLIYYTINIAKKSKYLDDYILNSDDKKIRQVASSFGVKTMDRPKKYAHDKILQEVDLLLRWTVKKYEKKYKKSRYSSFVIPNFSFKRREIIR